MLMKIIISPTELDKTISICIKAINESGLDVSGSVSLVFNLSLTHRARRLLYDSPMFKNTKKGPTPCEVCTCIS